MWTLDQGIAALKKKQFKVTAQRIAILRFLMGKDTHPCADTVFQEVKKNYPSLSIATVYSTAYMMSEAGLINILSIDGKRIYFDPQSGFHGHFLCEKCGSLKDVNLPDLDKTNDNVNNSLGLGHKINRTDIFFYGVCPPCS